MKINPQEIFLLERYISIEYIANLRDVWEEMTQHVDACLANFVKALPLDYRDRPLPQQPDIVWGDRVLPNFRNTLANLNNAVILLSHGDYSGLNFTYGPLSDFKGQLDFWSGWMIDEDDMRYHTLLSEAVMMATNINATDSASWDPRELSTDYDDNNRGALVPPAIWPTYQFSKNVTVLTSGEKVNLPGIYVPDLEDTCAQFLHKTAPLAKVFIGMKDLFAPDTGLKYAEKAEFTKKACTWRRIQRVGDSNVGQTPPTLFDQNSARIVGGDSCVKSGYYFSPARQDSRKWFNSSETMPDFGATYGATIWQWDQNQS